MAKQSNAHTTKSSKREVWDSIDKACVGLYGVNLDNPSSSRPPLGSSFRPLLTVDGETKERPPTLYNLASHLGYMAWMEPIIKRLVTQTRISADDLERIRAMCRKGSREMLEPRLGKLRHALRSFSHPLYFYCVPHVTQETDMVTGKPLRTEGERVLCVLPTTPQVAQHHGRSESEIALLAPQVMWLVTTLLPGQHVINTPAQLAEAIGDWPAYMNPAVWEQIQASLQQVHPHLIPAQTTHLFLLPGGVVS